jgi:hypothetical protein
MNTRRTSIMNTRTIYVAVIMLAGLLASVGTSQAIERFSLRSLRGIYGFSGSGTLSGGTVQAAVVGLNSFDGAGGCRITARLNQGGVVSSLTSATCSYTVNPDGTGFTHVTFVELPVPFTSDFVIVDQAKELHFVLSDEFSHTTVASGVAKRQRSGDTD